MRAMPVRFGGRLPGRFTLVEMLVVIAIIGILASLLMPALHGALGSSRLAGCSNNLRQIGIWGIQYSDEWNGVLPHNGGGWVGYYRGYQNASNSGWLSKCPYWQSTQRRGTLLHCPQMSASVTPFTGESWNPWMFSNTYALNFNLGGGHSDSTYAALVPRMARLSSHKLWFADGGGIVRADGRFAHFYMVDLHAWSGTGGQYVPFPFYYTEKDFHPGHTAVFLYGDGRVAGVSRFDYLALTVAQKNILSGK